MKKIALFIITLFLSLLLFGCANGNNEKSVDIDIQDSVGIDIWDVEPNYEFDNIDVDFSGKNYVFMHNNYPVYENEESPYGSFEKGGLIVIQNNRFGILNSKGEIVQKPSYLSMFYYENITQLETEDLLYAPFLLDDYSLKVEENTGFAPVGLPVGGGSSLNWNEDGYPVERTWELIFNEENPEDSKTETKENKIDLFEYTKSNKDCLFLAAEKNVIAHKDKYIVLDIDDDYVFAGFSNDVIWMAKCKNADFSKIYNNYYEYYSFATSSSYRYPTIRDESIYNVIYINSDGEIISAEYDNGYGFFEGFAPVKKNGKWGYIDKKGDVAVDFIFDKATPLCDGKAWVIYNGKTGRLNIVDMLKNNIPFTDEILSVKKSKND